MHRMPHANNVQTQCEFWRNSETNVDISQLNCRIDRQYWPQRQSVEFRQRQIAQRAGAISKQLTAGPDAKQLRQAQIAVETAQLSLDQAQKQRDNAVLKAPFDGVVAEVNIVPGTIPPSTGAITLINTSGYTITLSVDEKDITKLAGRAGRQPERAGAAQRDGHRNGHAD